MTTVSVNIPKIWSQLNGTNQEHALSYMEFLYHQQQESEAKPKPLPFGILKGKLSMTEDFDGSLPEFEDYR